MPVLNTLSRSQFVGLSAEQQLYRILNLLKPDDPLTSKKFESLNDREKRYEFYRVLNMIPGGLVNALTSLITSEIVGTIKIWPGDTAPDEKWGFVNGDQYVRADYPDLFAICGTRYNTGGEPGTHFRIPDLRGRVPAGLGNMGGNNADLLSVQIDGVTLGAKGGFELESYNIGAEYTTGSGGGFGLSSGLYSTIQPTIILAYVIKLLP